jgi:hypothetical protein
MPVTPGMRQEMADAYRNGESGTSIARRMKLSSPTVYLHLNMAGVQTRSMSQAKRKYARDDDYFEALDTPEKAYWAGFLAADGGLVNSTLHLHLESGDRQHVEKLKRALRYEGPLHDYSYTSPLPGSGRLHTSHQTYLAVVSPKMVADLTHHGITHRKSLTLKPWQAPTLKLACAWWRGVVDGDGHLGISGARPHIGLTGSVAMVRGFESFVRANTKCSRAVAEKRLKPNGRASGVQFGGTLLVQQIVRLLYTGGEVSLNRKQEAADRILSLEPEKQDWSHLSAGSLEEMHVRLGSWNAVRRQLGIQQCHLWRVRQRLGMPDATRHRRQVSAGEIEAAYAEAGSWLGAARLLRCTVSYLHVLRRRSGQLTGPPTYKPASR